MENQTQDAPSWSATELTERCALFRNWLRLHYNWVNADDCSQYFALKVLEGRSITTEFHWIAIDYIREFIWSDKLKTKKPIFNQIEKVQLISNNDIERFHDYDENKKRIDKLVKFVDESDMSKTLKETFNLFLTGMTHEEIAKLQGVTPNAVTQKMKRIREFILATEKSLF